MNTSKLDDAGLHLMEQTSEAKQATGRLILRMAPKLMKTLSVLGTAAMFLVGGGILVHGAPFLAETLHHLEELVQGAAGLAAVVGMAFNGIVGVIAGGLIVGAQSLAQRALAGSS